MVRSEGYESILRHSHSFIEIVFVESGRALHNVGESCVEIEKGDVFVIATGEEHNIRPSARRATLRSSTSFVATNCLRISNFPPRIKCFPVRNFVTRRNSRSSNRNLRRNTVRKRSYTCSFATWSTVSRSNDFSDERKSVRGKLSSRTIDDYILNATAFIQENYMKKLLLKDIADAVGLYPAYLQKIFREHRSTSVIEYLIRYRMEKSCRFLLETELTVEEISLLVGVGGSEKFLRDLQKIFRLHARAVSETARPQIKFTGSQNHELGHDQKRARSGGAL